MRVSRRGSQTSSPNSRKCEPTISTSWSAASMSARRWARPRALWPRSQHTTATESEVVRSGGNADLLAEAAEHPVGCEPLFGQGARGPAVMLVAREDRLHSRDRTLDGAEAQQALPG